VRVISNVIGQNLRSIQRSIFIDDNGASEPPIDCQIQSLTGEHKHCLGVAQRTRNVAVLSICCVGLQEFGDADAAVTELKAEAPYGSNQNLEAAL
jgi:hypothetical protein